jgi:hypothetical protein
MSRIDDWYDEVFPEDIEVAIKHLDNKQSAGKKRLKARRKIEDIREKRRLKRQLDFYDTDY